MSHPTIPTRDKQRICYAQCRPSHCKLQSPKACQSRKGIKKKVNIATRVERDAGVSARLRKREENQKDDRTNSNQMQSKVFDTNDPDSDVSRKRQRNEEYVTDTVWERWKKIDAAGRRSAYLERGVDQHLHLILAGDNKKRKELDRERESKSQSKSHILVIKMSMS